MTPALLTETLSHLYAGVQDLPLFVATGIALNLTPGADMALVAQRSVRQGFAGGAAAALGVGAGCWVHTAAAAAGLSAVLAASPWAYAVLRWVGAAYLVWLGLALLRSRATAASAAPDHQGHLRSADALAALRATAWQGFLTNALNPKVAFFFLAFVPQFIRNDAAHPALAFALLGTVFVVNSTLVNIGLAALVARVAQRAGQRPGVQRLGLWLNRGVGALFVAFGLKLALGATAPR